MDMGLELALAPFKGVLRQAFCMDKAGCDAAGGINPSATTCGPAYKSTAGLPRVLLGQFEPMEEAFAALGVGTWPMLELAVDEAVAAAAIGRSNGS